MLTEAHLGRLLAAFAATRLLLLLLLLLVALLPQDLVRLQLLRIIACLRLCHASEQRIKVHVLTKVVLIVFIIIA
jgi:hypothetical protein